MKFKLGIIKLSFVNKVRFWGRIINSSHFRTIASQQGVPKKSPLYRNHSFVVNTVEYKGANFYRGHFFGDTLYNYDKFEFQSLAILKLDMELQINARFKIAFNLGVVFLSIIQIDVSTAPLTLDIVDGN